MNENHNRGIINQRMIVEARAAETFVERPRSRPSVRITHHKADCKCSMAVRQAHEGRPCNVALLW